MHYSDRQCVVHKYQNKLQFSRWVPQFLRGQFLVQYLLLLVNQEFLRPNSAKWTCDIILLFYF